MSSIPSSGRQMSPMLLAAYILALLLVADLACFGLHLLRMFNPYLGTEHYSLEFDRGYGEFLQYIKTSWIILLLMRLGILKRAFCFFAWAMVYTWLLLDDALQLHEGLGRQINRMAALPEIMGMRSQDLGELMVTAAAGVVLLTVLAISYRRDGPVLRKLSRQLLALTLCLGFFGVVVDMLHSVLRDSPGVHGWAGFIEDGGEMLVMTVVVWYTFALAVQDGMPAPSVLRLLREAISRVARLS